MTVIRRSAIKFMAGSIAVSLYGQINGYRRESVITADGHAANLDAVVMDLAAPEQTGMIGAAIQTLGRNEEDGIRGNQ